MEEQQVNTQPKDTNVKDEPKIKEVDSEGEVEEPDFLDELLNSADDIVAAIAEASTATETVAATETVVATETVAATETVVATATEAATETVTATEAATETATANTSVKPEVVNATIEEPEPIDSNFFDEILVREEDESRQLPLIRVKQFKRERGDLEEGEVEIVDDNNDDTQGNNIESKKHKSKKSKKSKRKKSKESPIKIKTEKIDSSSNTNSNVTAPRIQVRAELRSFRTPSPTTQPPPEENADFSEQPPQQIETYIGNYRRYQPLPFQLSVLPMGPQEQKPEKKLTSEEKLGKALETIIHAKRAFQRAKLQKDKMFYPNNPVFAYTPTVRKLPTSFSHFTQNIYDNRSPLHTVNNVTFQFNSMVTRLNLEEWGLESLPRKAEAVARTLGYDVYTLFAKRQSIKIPDKIQKSIETTANTEEKELCEKSNSTLFMNVMVQTDQVKVIPLRRRDFYRDEALQCTPLTNVIGTQTNPIYTGSGGDLPLFNIIRKLNENQLEALDDFLQLILEPATNSSLDVYQQRKRLADIYKTSQIPSETRSSHKRSANEAGFSQRMPSPPPPPDAYMHHDFIKKERREPDNYKSPPKERRRPHSHRNFHSRNADSSDDESAPSLKFYGRGGMRR